MLIHGLDFKVEWSKFIVGASFFIPCLDTEEALIQILTEPKNALVKQYQALLTMEGSELEVRREALSAIAKKAIARKTGARGLRSILEGSLMDVMYDLPSLKNVQKVVIDESSIAEGGKPLLVYKQDAEQADLSKKA